jgi:hypothetical protein
MSGITLNLLEINLSKDKLNVFRAHYNDELWDKVKDLRDYFGFHRVGEYFYSWQIKNSEIKLPDEFSPCEVNLPEFPSIFSKVIEKSFVDLFWKNDYKIYKNEYSSCWDMPLKKTSPVQFEALELKPFMGISFHAMESKKSGNNIIGITAKKRYRPSFIQSEEDLNSKHIDTRNWDRDVNGKIKTTQNNIDEYLKSSGQWDKYATLIKELYSDESSFEEFHEFYQNLQSVVSKLFLPDELKIESIRLNVIPNSNFNFEIIKKPTYFYFNERSKLGRAYYDQALAELRPYSFARFQNRLIKILVLIPQEHEGTTESFCKRIEDRFRRIFHTPKIEFKIEVVDQHGGYVETINNTDVTDLSLILVILSEKDKEFSIEESTYYLTKAKSLNLGIPTQDVTIEKIKQRNYLIENNIALNMYAKIGGIGWTIEKDEKNKTELIIGVGSTIDENNNKTIGFANIFDWRGTYLMGDCSQLSTKETYVEDLERHLTESIKSVLSKTGIQPKSSIRLIFHLRKEAGIDTELLAIEKALENFRDFDVQVAILHLGLEHNFKLFNDDGNLKVSRGTFVQLSPFLALLHLGGNTSNPLQIRLDKRSTFVDITDLAKQVLFFCHLSQSSFIPANLPVTVRYPSVMARLTSSLNKLTNWDNTQLNRLKEKLWFL